MHTEPTEKDRWPQAPAHWHEFTDAELEGIYLHAKGGRLEGLRAVEAAVRRQYTFFPQSHA